MFDAFIIDWIRKEDAKRHRESDRPYLEVPPVDSDRPADRDVEPCNSDRGVVIIDRSDDN